ncbi:nicotinate-nucleotide adenylyltransferase [Aureimonas fodinaquatilis]|uniref:Probable nicotinate-nucleotide adenylyltransferase n=1 Tax=Aureimonas fodinaquatilis TaxID=2565783 RepID=A0A5B0DV10_9HYPH|nr:nicotinate-nucleotide adenylyltransferase [Aureimonas fodinaquatilis]
MPHCTPGMKIGLLGGSFNPPHMGHRLVAEMALRRLGLQKLWWMVTPGNPLKDHGVLEPLSERLRLSRDIAANPRISVTGFEAAHKIRYSADTVQLLKVRCPGVKFVWIMGADSLATFHLWQDWQDIFTAVPIAIIDRPGSTLSLLSSPAAQTFKKFRLREERAASLATMRPPAWVFLHGPRSSLSSSAIRAAEKS